MKVCAVGRRSRLLPWSCSPPWSWRSRSRPRRRPPSARGRTTAPKGALLPRHRGHAHRRHLRRMPHRLPELPRRDLLDVPRARPGHHALLSTPTPTATPSESSTSTPTPTPTESSACSQECHLWNSVQKQYTSRSRTATNPHLGSTSACLDCHPTSVSWDDPGSSPHHSGQATGFTQCGACHSSQQKHAGKVACATCHTSAQAFHLYQANSPGFKKCGSCHTMRHAGKKIAQASAPPATRAPAAGRSSTPRRSPRSSSAAAATSRSCTRGP